ncbi:MAG: 6-bladed beta-propeller [Bacteroidales bacterium]|nr:6-bladed beta-propeller [Bacteroidales bacterium]
MKTKHLFIPILLVNLCLATSCTNTSGDIPVIDLDNPIGYIDLKLSDLLDDITIVPLETRDDLLLSTRASFTVSSRYILADVQDKLLQFDRQGKFIRTLATQGNGPNEFEVIVNPLIDEDQEIFYYSSYGRNRSISRISMKTATFPEPLYLDMPPFSIKEIDNKGNIYGFPAVVDSVLLAYRYSPADKSVTIYQRHHPFVAGGIDQEMYRQGDHIFFFSFPYSDTLFKIDGSKTIPQYIIKANNLRTRDLAKGDVGLKIRYSGAKGTIIEKWRQQVLTNEYGRTFGSYAIAYLFLNERQESQSIRSITIDPLALTIYELITIKDADDYIKSLSEMQRRTLIRPFPAISGLWGHIAVESADMIERIEQALKSSQLSTLQRKRLEEVSTKIDEDSNPVLIIGKVK